MVRVRRHRGETEIKKRRREKKVAFFDSRLQFDLGRIWQRVGVGRRRCGCRGKQVPHWAWRPVRNDKVKDGCRHLTSAFPILRRLRTFSSVSRSQRQQKSGPEIGSASVAVTKTCSKRRLGQMANCCRRWDSMNRGWTSLDSSIRHLAMCPDSKANLALSEFRWDSSRGSDYSDLHPDYLDSNSDYLSYPDSEKAARCCRACSGWPGSIRALRFRSAAELYCRLEVDLCFPWAAWMVTPGPECRNLPAVLLLPGRVAQPPRSRKIGSRKVT